MTAFLIPEIWQYQTVSLAWILKTADALVLSVYLSPSIHLELSKDVSHTERGLRKKKIFINSIAMYVQVKKREVRKQKQSLALSHAVQQLPISISHSIHYLLLNGNVMDDRGDVGCMAYKKVEKTNCGIVNFADCRIYSLPSSGDCLCPHCGSTWQENTGGTREQRYSPL